MNRRGLQVTKCSISEFVGIAHVPKLVLKVDMEPELELVSHRRVYERTGPWCAKVLSSQAPTRRI